MRAVALHRLINATTTRRGPLNRHHYNYYSSSSASSGSSNCNSKCKTHIHTHSQTLLSLSPWSAIQRRGVKVKPGNVIEKSGRIYQVIQAEHKQQGRGGAMMQLELRDVDNGSKQNLRFGTEEAVERVYVEERSFTCLYTEGEMAYLMDSEKFEQLEVPIHIFGKAAAYLKEEMKIKLQLFDGRPLSGLVPKKVTCLIKETQANPKGLTVTPRYIKALLDNGLNVQVPSYLEAGEEIVVNTDDDTYVSRR